MSKKSSGMKVISNSIIYTFSGLMLKCFSFFLLPLYTTYLTTDDYGITSVANSFISTMSFIVAFSLYSAIMRFYVDYQREPEKLARFYGTVWSFVVCSSVFFGCLLFAFKEILINYVFSGIDFFPVVFVCLISLAFNCQQTIFENILRSQQKAVRYSILNICYFFLSLVLNIVFVVVFHLGALGVVCATAVASAVYSIYFLTYMIKKREITICLDFSLLRNALKYSIPIMPHNLSTNIAELVSKALIGGKVSLSSLGLFSIAAQFGTISDTVQVYVNNAYAPWLYEKLEGQEDGYKSTIRRIVGTLTQLLGVFLLGIALFSQDYIVLFLKKSYALSWIYVPLIVVVYSIKLIYYFYVNILLYYKKASKVLFVATLSSSIINILISSIVIPIWGAYGSIAADGIAMLIRVTMIVIISKQFEDIGLKLSDLLVNITVIIIFVFVGLYFSYTKYRDVFSVNNFMYKVAIFVIYVFVVAVRNKAYIGMILKNEVGKYESNP